ncbi:Putative NAD(P)-dependent oxidoreductase [Listeria ivanovii subsp. ivanovii PAM 55]|uniref:Putative NAD(P)-dependent oxidoreductase n=1 Tax=Listeria ivanovii (strain ATCC BAA-678 / PAM 55) TaxID=881621 RepID=G2ZBT3_LISIP|nr:SAF domain-containing protein [Listeria ivanovii]MBK3913671.1 NAD(P)-dependent oxidoreductase [Listeria ivanovii subsp. ivanovii]MBK3920211.1 NAD(P)-dependent oxidoreductase [Listeria ivanovii subsp. ivanovii]MBK3925961.1 NAD(P)-dependent oxidoreductase [Listeria ivanovii subsp. ivanovii]MCJ1716721.1 SAF domain-containing protein [Listeria ivanovii]MCJ1721372.1 SAF domain-containing protein [Listeria ivanovii]
MTLYRQLLAREQENNPIRVGVIGAGQMGFGMISQIAAIPGMSVVGISDIHVEAAKKAADAYNATAAKKEKILLSNDFKEIIHSDQVEVIVDATGVPEVGAKISLETLLAKKQLVLLNVEIDITIGPLMKKLYDSAGLVYTGSDGDEPAAITELYEFSKSMGMEVLVAGKGKNNKLKISANPDSCQVEADEKNMASHMLAAFQDGTKTMAEMNLLSNAIGYVPDVVGMHGISGDVDSVIKDLDLKEQGGILNKFGVVEYVDGLAPGVFVIVKGQNEGVSHELSYLMKKGDRDHHILYRPYHLASLETPLTIAKAVLNHDHAIVPKGAPISETVAVAKKDIPSGERLDGIGGFCVRGVLETHTDMATNGHIPIGLISGEVVARRNIKTGTFITEEDVTLDESTTVWKLRKLQDETFSN